MNKVKTTIYDWAGVIALGIVLGWMWAEALLGA